MEQAGTVSDRAAIARALEGISYTGPFGRSQVLPNHTISGPMGLVIAGADQLTLYVFADSSTTDKPTTSIAAKNTYSQ